MQAVKRDLPWGEQRVPSYRVLLVLLQ